MTRAARVAGAVLLVVLGPAPVAAAAPTHPARDVLRLEPGRLLVLRDDRVRRVLTVPEKLDLSQLPGLLREPELVRSKGKGVIRLAASIEQEPGSRLVVQAPSTTRVDLVDGARLSGTNAVLSVYGVTVTASGRSRPDAAAPVVGYANGSGVRLSRTTVVDRRRAGSVAGPTLEVSGGSAVRLVSVRLTGGTGATLERVADAELVGLVVDRSQGTGLAADQVRRLSLRSVTLTGNDGDGLTVTGPTRRLRTRGGVVATGNRGAGVRLENLQDVELRGIRTADNGSVGLRVLGVTRVGLNDVTSRADPVAVSVTGATGLQVTGADAAGTRARGARPGAAAAFRVDRSTGVVLQEVRTADHGIGLALSGRDLSVRAGDLTGTTTGLLVLDGSDRVSVLDTSATGGRDGIAVRAGAAAVELSGVTAEATGAGGVRLRAEGGRVTVTGGALSGATSLLSHGGARVSTDGTVLSRPGERLRIPVGRLLLAGLEILVAAFLLEVLRSRRSPDLRDDRLPDPHALVRLEP